MIAIASLTRRVYLKGIVMIATNIPLISSRYMNAYYMMKNDAVVQNF